MEVLIHLDPLDNELVYKVTLDLWERCQDLCSSDEMCSRDEICPT